MMTPGEEQRKIVDYSPPKRRDRLKPGSRSETPQFTAQNLIDPVAMTCSSGSVAGHGGSPDPIEITTASVRSSPPGSAGR
jgi:hypothetical protein